MISVALEDDSLWSLDALHQSFMGLFQRLPAAFSTSVRDCQLLPAALSTSFASLRTTTFLLFLRSSLT